MLGVKGTFSGNGVHVESPTRTDRLAFNTCSFDSSGTTAAQAPFIGLNAWTKTMDLSGVRNCPAGMATSTAASSCTSQVISGGQNLFELSIEVSGWTDSSIVTFKVRNPPGGLPGCNHASVILSGWDIQATTTVGKFRAGTAFPVRFVGARMLNISSPWVKSSDVSWDFTMTVKPL